MEAQSNTGRSIEIAKDKNHPLLFMEFIANQLTGIRKPKYSIIDNPLKNSFIIIFERITKTDLENMVNYINLNS